MSHLLSLSSANRFAAIGIAFTALFRFPAMRFHARAFKHREIQVVRRGLRDRI
jgi:hypothetical protein